MSRRQIAWQEGEERVQRRVEQWFADGASATSQLLAESERRILYRLDIRAEPAIDPHGHSTTQSVVVKIHRTHSGRHRRRESFKKCIGFSPASREWRALEALHAKSVPVPQPLAWGQLQSGDPLLVTEYCQGTSLLDALSIAGPEQQMTWIERLACSVEALHGAGYRHGDLHLGNLHTRGSRVVIFDLQRARRARSDGERLRDLAHLDFSIARRGFDLELRHRLRAALGHPRDFDAASRRFIHDFVRGRSRREFRLGHAWESWRSGPLSGLRESATSLPALAEALGAALTAPRSGDRRGGRSQISVHGNGSQALVVKRMTTPTLGRAGLDLLRGSPALRGFRIGQRLALLGSLGARPLAALDQRSRGLPEKSWLIMQSVGLCDLDAYRPRCEREARRCAIALARWIAEWQAWGIEHRDLKAGNIRVDDREGRFRFWLIDLEDLRFRSRVDDAARRRALVQLNASLADEAFSLRSRLLGLDAYLERLPFEGARRNALARAIARDSIARNHHWRGDDCKDTEGSAP